MKNSPQPRGVALNFRFTDFEINIARQELRRAGAIVHIEPQVFDLLVHLIRNRDRIVGKDELIDTVWQGRIVSEATLSSRINAARRALGDSGNDQSLIRTLYKRGFRLVGDLDDDSSAPAAIAIEKAPPLQGAAHDAAELVPTGEPLPLSDKPLIGAPPSPNMGLDSDREYVADGLTAAAAPLLAPPNQASGVAGVHKIVHGDRRAHPAPIEKGIASRKGSRRGSGGPQETCCSRSR
jgi:DNA-binding winged helix-turn-helix (wHTH) protein